MSRQLNWDLLDRYLSGACTPEQAEEITRWAATDPAHARELEAVRRIWEAAAAGADRFDTNGQWRILQSRIVPQRRSVHRRRRTMSIAAGLLLATGLGVGALWAWRSGALRPERPTARRPVAMREYITREGQRADILLADGTRAVVSVASRLRVPVDYGATARDVYLEGEAYFEVRHNARAPFRVHAGRAIARDIGTAFVVRAYSDEPAVTVVVRSGRVALHADTAAAARSVVLGAGELGRLDSAARLAVEHHVDVDAYLAWTRGHLTFRLRPFAEVARELERWYGLHITWDDPSLAATPVTASFVDQPESEVLAILAQLLDVRYHRDGSRVQLITGRSR